MERKPFIAGNWKMHMTVAAAEQLAAAVVATCSQVHDRDVAVAPPYTALAAVARVVAGTPVQLAAQNVHWEEKGAFTGEISPVMLKDIGCGLAIVGHSERRHIFFESDGLINRRLLGALRQGIKPIFCIGETLAEREAGRTLAVLEGQIRAGLAGVEPATAGQVVIAYEPVWAIGTGKTATENQAQDIHAFVRKLVGELFDKTVAGHMRILYGGSVKAENIDVLMRQEDIDGVLVGGAALQAEEFDRIIRFQ
ncbi:MAG: triose-phosphate isomerase [Deltaproteobacteria bacterium RIFOXYD12_FULL_57_12]|nr:MAG: triose-phosphate isomerase [Deltaproteobacteria bacterium RIFOXYD12_FULL_57_12]